MSQLFILHSFQMLCIQKEATMRDIRARQRHIHMGHIDRNPKIPEIQETPSSER